MWMEGCPLHPQQGGVKMKNLATVVVAMLVAVATSVHAAEEEEVEILGWTIETSYGYAAWEEDRSVAKEGSGEESVQLSEHVFGANAFRKVFETNSLRLDLGVGGFYHPEDETCTSFASTDLLPFSKICSTTEAYSVNVNGNATVPVTDTVKLKFGVGVGHYLVDAQLDVTGVPRVGGEDQGVSTNFLAGILFTPTESVEIGADVRHHQMYEDDVKIEPLTTVGLNAAVRF